MADLLAKQMMEAVLLQASNWYLNMVYMHILLSSQLKNRNKIMKCLNKPRTAIGIVLLVWKETLYKNSLVFNAENCLRQAIARYLKEIKYPTLPLF